MPRKPNAPSLNTTAVVVAEQAHTAAAAHDSMAQIAEGYSADRDLANQLLGQAQMADTFMKLSKTVFTSKLAFVKENKLYLAIKSEDGLQSGGSWDSYCALLGITPQHANESIANLKAFGEEALESMSQMGIGYRDLRQFRRLTDDGKQALIEAAKAGDKDAFIDLAETILERSTKKDARIQELEEATAAKDKVIEADKARMTQLEEKLARPYKPKKGSPALTKQDADALQELTEATTACEVGFARLATVVGELAEHESLAMRERALQSAAYMVAWMRQTVMAHGLDVRVDDEALTGRPSWMPGLDATGGAATGNAANQG